MTNPRKVLCDWRKILDARFGFGDILIHGRPCLRGPIREIEIIKRHGEASEEVEWVRVTVRWLGKKDPTDLLNEEVPWVYCDGEKLVLEFPNKSTLWSYELTYPQDGSNVPTKIKVGNCSIFVGGKQIDPNAVEGFPT